MAEPAPAPIAEPKWSKTVVSLFGLLIYLIAFLVAYMAREKDPQVFTLMAGSAIGIGTQVLNYWLGSSAGSDKKTDILNKSSTQ